MKKFIEHLDNFDKEAYLYFSFALILLSLIFNDQAIAIAALISFVGYFVIKHYKSLEKYL